MLIAPTEPPMLRQLGQTSSAPERYGADFLWHSPMFGAVGVQRKEIGDLVASAYDGRLAKELAQMKVLGLGVIVIEGRLQWTSNGLLLGNYSRWSISQHLGTLWSARLSGYWTDTTADQAGTCEWLSMFQKWTSKPRHSGVLSRPGPEKNEWGRQDSRDWGIHLLQSFPGIGAGTAAAIYDHFHGVPMTWIVGERELQEVEGVGKGRAKSMVKALESTFEYEVLDEG